MTAQISDTFIFKGDEYSLIGMTSGDLASPEQFGMEPEMIHTACYRGFYATYELTEKALYLRKLSLREKNENYLPIGGIEPEQEEFQATYHGLSVLVPFTGKIRLAKDFIEELYIHMGYQKPTAFKTVLDMTLKGPSSFRVERNIDNDPPRSWSPVGMWAGRLPTCPHVHGTVFR
ncbi:MAG: hypothetical protein JSR84_00910, partial [Proteobacteria bacterium]|nr:hypothetical protein [Pseudomonadota bacterium]